MSRAFRFGAWSWDPNTLELRNGAHIVTLEPRVARLFEILLAHPGELLTHDRLVEAVWDGRVVSDEAVRRAVFNLRQALAVDGADQYIRTIHKKGYVAAFPQPLFDSAEPPEAGSVTPRIDVPYAEQGVSAVVPRMQTLLRIFGVLALGALALTRFEELWLGTSSPAPVDAQATAPAAIAVLPFIALGEEADSELLAEGLAEELLGALARNPGLRVTARSSAFQFKDQGRDPRDVGQRLGVRYVLEGSVRQAVERVRIHARLIDAHTGLQLWTEVYDRGLADWFALQQDIAAEVARALKPVLRQGDTPAAPTGTASVDAHLEVLRARQLIASQVVADAERAIEHLQRALALDPDYAVAYARLADAILIKAGSTSGVPAVRTVVAPLLDKALALDPGLGEAHALRSMLSDDPAAAERELRRGLELNPSNARAYELLANLQSKSLEQIDLALSTIDHAIALDPLTPGLHHSKAQLRMIQGDWPAVAVLERRAIELNPQFRAALMQLGFVSGAEGDFAQAIGYGERAMAIDPRAIPVRKWLAVYYIAAGDLDGARAVDTPPAADVQLAVLVASGNADRADIPADLVYAKESMVERPVVPELMSQVVLRQAMADRDFARARAAVATVLPLTASLPSEAQGWRLYAYANLVQLLAASGETAAAAELQQQIEARMQAAESRFPRYALLHDQVRATLLAHAGRGDEACAALERTYARAPRMFWWMVMTNPAFDGMRSLPCLQALQARVDAHLRAERARIEAMRRAGQIPDRTHATRQTVIDAHT